MKRVGGRTDGRTDGRTCCFILLWIFLFLFRGRRQFPLYWFLHEKTNEFVSPGPSRPGSHCSFGCSESVRTTCCLFVCLFVRVPCFFLSPRYTSSFVKLSLWRFVLSLVCSTPLWVNSISSLMLTLTRSRSLSLESLTNASSSRHAFYFFPSFSLFLVSHKSLCRTTTHPLYFFYTPWSVSK